MLSLSLLETMIGGLVTGDVQSGTSLRDRASGIHFAFFPPEVLRC